MTTPSSSIVNHQRDMLHLLCSRTRFKFAPPQLAGNHEQQQPPRSATLAPFAAQPLAHHHGHRRPGATSFPLQQPSRPSSPQFRRASTPRPSIADLRSTSPEPQHLQQRRPFTHLSSLEKKSSLEQPPRRSSRAVTREGEECESETLILERESALPRVSI